MLCGQDMVDLRDGSLCRGIVSLKDGAKKTQQASMKHDNGGDAHMGFPGSVPHVPTHSLYALLHLEGVSHSLGLIFVEKVLIHWLNVIFNLSNFLVLKQISFEGEHH